MMLNPIQLLLLYALISAFMDITFSSSIHKTENDSQIAEAKETVVCIAQNSSYDKDLTGYHLITIIKNGNGEKYYCRKVNKPINSDQSSPPGETRPKVLNIAPKQMSILKDLKLLLLGIEEKLNRTETQEEDTTASQLAAFEIQPTPFEILFPTGMTQMKQSNPNTKKMLLTLPSNLYYQRTGNKILLIPPMPPSVEPTATVTVPSLKVQPSPLQNVFIFHSSHGKPHPKVTANNQEQHHASTPANQNQQQLYFGPAFQNKLQRLFIEEDREQQLGSVSLKQKQPIHEALSKQIPNQKMPNNFNRPFSNARKKNYFRNSVRKSNERFKIEIHINDVISKSAPIRKTTKPSDLTVPQTTLATLVKRFPNKLPFSEALTNHQYLSPLHLAKPYYHNSGSFYLYGTPSLSTITTTESTVPNCRTIAQDQPKLITYPAPIPIDAGWALSSILQPPPPTPAFKTIYPPFMSSPLNAQIPSPTKTSYLPTSIRIFTVISMIASFFLLLFIDNNVHTKKLQIAHWHNRTAAIQDVMTSLPSTMMLGSPSTSGGSGSIRPTRDPEDLEEEEALEMELQERREKKERTASKLDFLGDIVALKTFIDLLVANTLELMNNEFKGNSDGGAGSGGGAGGLAAFLSGIGNSNGHNSVLNYRTGLEPYNGKKTFSLDSRAVEELLRRSVLESQHKPLRYSNIRSSYPARLRATADGNTGGILSRHQLLFRALYEKKRRDERERANRKKRFERERLKLLCRRSNNNHNVVNRTQLPIECRRIRPNLG